MTGIRNLSTRREGFSWPLPDVAVTNVNTSYINALSVWGHSYIDTLVPASIASGFQIANKLHSALGIQWPLARNYGVGGTGITDDWKRMFRTARPSSDNWGDSSWQAKFSPQVFLYGANDVGRNGAPDFENSRFLNDWGNSWRGVLSWFRAGAIYTPDWIFGDASHAGTDGLAPWAKAGVTYSGGWAATLSDDYASVGATAYQATTSSQTIAVRLPPRHPGTPVTLYFAGEVGATGSTAGTVTHGGVTPASPVALVTNDRVRTPSTYLNLNTQLPQATVPTLVPIRITGIPAGDGSTSQTITVNSGALSAGHKLTFLGWSIESSHPPLLTVANVPPARSWASSLLNTDAVPGNGNDDGSYVGSGSVPLRWPAYPQSNSIQQVGGGPAFNGGVRIGAHAADGWCLNYYNPTLATVAAEFAPAGTVAIADLYTAFSGVTHPEFWSPNDLGAGDHFHPNNLGKSVIVEEFLTAMNRVPLPVQHLMAPTDANETALTLAELLERPEATVGGFGGGPP